MLQNRRIVMAFFRNDKVIMAQIQLTLDYIPNIVGLSSYSCICLYSAHPKDPWVDGRYCVSVVLIRCLPTDTPYILGHMVDRRCDTPIEFFVVHSQNIGARRVRL